MTRMTLKDVPTHEADAIRALGDWLPRTMEEGVRNRGGVVDEYVAMVAPWGFDPASITAPVDVHQGSADTLVPESWGHELAHILKDATLCLHPGDGHMIGVTRRAEVVSSLVPRS
jgi:hypothetical protein